MLRRGGIIGSGIASAAVVVARVLLGVVMWPALFELAEHAFHGVAADVARAREGRLAAPYEAVSAVRGSHVSYFSPVG